MEVMDVPPQLLRLARIGLDLGQQGLAEAAGVSPKTISNLESNVRTRLETRLRVKEALERFGVQFIIADEYGGYGLRFRPSWPPTANYNE